jgi:hypothetical protein
MTARCKGKCKTDSIYNKLCCIARSIIGDAAGEREKDQAWQALCPEDFPAVVIPLIGRT